LTVTDGANRVTVYTYDVSGRLNGVVLPGGQNYGFAYDASGNRTGVTMPGGDVHNLSYTAVNLDASYTPPGAGSYLWSYNPDRQRTLVTLPGGRAIQSLFDNAGRPTGFAYPEANVTFTYADNTGRVKQIGRTSAGQPVSQTLNFSYDGQRVTGIAWNGIAIGQFGYTYRTDGDLGSIALTSGSDSVTVGLAYDIGGFLTGYGPFALIRGGPAGAVSEIRNATLSLASSYDALGRLTDRTQTVSGSQRFLAQFIYNASSQISQTIENSAGTADDYRYVYDATGRLTHVHRDGTLIERYTYDAHGNRTSRLVDGATENAVYDTQDRLTQRGTVVYGFDSDGYLTSRGSDTYQYSARGELVQATAGGQTITYAYDGLGRRVARTDSGGKTQYLYGNPKDVFQITAMRDPSGLLTFFYYDEAGLLIAFKRGGATYYVATDLVGTPRVVSDASGAVVKSLAYDSFGVPLADSNPAFDLSIGFAGGLADPATGLVRFGLRDYEPLSGRWTARDAALFQADQANLYVYVGNDPVNHRDLGGFVSVSASAYALLGVGVKLSITGQGFSFCWEGGVGLGGDVEIDPFGKLDSDGLKAGAEAEVSLGPLSLKKAVKYDDCGRSGESQACLGPLCASGSSLSDLSSASGKYSPEKLLNEKDAFEPKDASKWAKVGVQAKATFGYCMGSKW
jgi:RHS repeat-associated protein